MAVSSATRALGRASPRPDLFAASQAWRAGNRVVLLENGDDFFPRVFEAIAAARHEVLLETFILFEDSIGARLREMLVAAARRGVRVHVTVDGYGSPDLSPEFVDALVSAGARLHVFDPCPKVFGMRLKLIRRMHRKIVVIDAERAFVGGINFSERHLLGYGERAQQDYAVELEGPVVADIREFARAVLDGAGAEVPAPQARPAPRAGPAEVLFRVRDNGEHRSDIEREYRAAIRAARREILIANAFFIPSHRLLRDIRDAARRGVRVTLIVQGKPDQQYAIAAARRLYGYLAPAGVQIYEYDERAFHGKLAMVDERWATVGSSNLDPLSLALNLEANVFIRDEAFSRQLRERMQGLIAASRRIEPAQVPRRPVRDTVLAWLLFQFVRRYQGWARRMPEHRAGLAPLRGSADPPREPAPRQTPAPDEPAGKPRHRAWRWLGRGLAVAFAVAVAFLLVRYVRTVKWADVWQALASYEAGVLAAAAALAALSFGLYSTYDILARRYAGHDLPASRVMTIAVVSYAFNLNLGSLIGGAAFRLRLYSRAGLPAATIARILAFSVSTNWLGYLPVAGAAFAVGGIALPEGWSLGRLGLRGLGVLLILAALGYLVACAWKHDSTWSVRGHEIRLPSLRLALAQLCVAAANWLTIGTIVFLLLHGQIPFATVLGVMLLAAIAGTMTHIPAGLGVLEVVVLTLLGDRLPQHTLLAALVAYRAVYYIAPLLVALLAYLRLEAIAAREGEAR